MWAKRLSILIVWLLTLMLASWQLVFRTTVSSDMGVFLPLAEDDAYGLLMAELQEGPGSRIILGVIEGGTAEALVAVSRDLGARLRESGQFADVFNGNAGMAEATRDLLFRYRYLLSPHTRAHTFSVPALTEAFEQRLVDLSMSYPADSTGTLRADPTFAFSGLLKFWSANVDGIIFYQGIWMSAERDAAYLLLRVAAQGTDLDAQERALRSLKVSFDVASAGSALRLIATGAPAIAVATRDRIRQEALWLSVAAIGFVVSLLWWVYRQFRVVLLVVLPLISGVLVAAATVSAAYGVLHGITIAFGITLLGVAVDYPVHFFSHRRLGELAVDTMNRLWATMLLGILTTALGYSAMTLSPIAGLSQMGLFTCVGLLVAGSVTRLVLPILARKQADRDSSPVWVPPWLTRPPNRVLRTVGLGVSVAAFVVLIATPHPWSAELTDLSPVPADLAKLDGALRDRMSAPDARFVVVVSGKDADEVLARQEKLAPVLRESVESGEIGGFQMASLYLPSRSTQEIRRLALPAEDLLRKNMDIALEDLPFKDGAFEPFVEDVLTSRALPPLRWAEFRQAELGAPLDELLHPVDDGWLGFIQVTSVARPDGLRSRLINWPDASVQFLDLKKEIGDVVDRFRQAAVSRVCWAILVVLLVLAIALRDVRRFFRVGAPMLATVAVAAAVPLILGARLSLFHVLALLLVAGISIDYGLFFTRPGQQAADFVLTLHALLVCVLTTGVTFALLMFSSIPVLHAVGSVVFTGVVAGFLLCWLCSSYPPARGTRAD